MRPFATGIIGDRVGQTPRAYRKPVLCIWSVQLYGGETSIRLSLCGFNDTSYHGWHVHAFGSTDNYCLAAGPHFNPRNQQHGAPTDINRSGDSLSTHADRQSVDISFTVCLCVCLYGYQGRPEGGRGKLPLAPHCRRGPAILRG